MSHYSVLVLVEATPQMSREDIAALVETALAPYQEQKWDWYQIGGRWTGHFDGYNPELDATNLETCDLCGGTGDRATFLGEPKEIQHPTGCNGCLGTGTRAKWPTQWPAHEGDVKPVSALTENDLNIYAICDSERGWFGGEDYLPWKPIEEMFTKRELPPLSWLQKEYAEHVAVIVDCHN